MRKALLKKKTTLLSLGVGGVLSVLVLPSVIVWHHGKGRSSSEISQLKASQVGIVLGTSPKTGGHDNKYFQHRMEAAASLYKSGKVKCLLLSGANPSQYYNEPKEMKMALVKLGVPEKVIVLDYAGLRTLDSVVRAKKIFGVNDAIFVSQAFHNHRALFIAQHFGMKASAYNAEDVSVNASVKTRGREVLARVKMFLDLHILKTQPRFLGEKIALPV